MTGCEERRNEASVALEQLERVVYQIVVEHNPIKRAYTSDFSFQLGLTCAEDIAIVKAILNKLQSKGLVENIGDNQDAWYLVKQ